MSSSRFDETVSPDHSPSRALTSRVRVFSTVGRTVRRHKLGFRILEEVGDMCGFIWF